MLTKSEMTTEFGNRLREQTHAIEVSPWNTPPINLAYFPDIDYSQSRYLYHNLAEMREAGAIPDTFVYAFRQMRSVLVAADNDKGREVAQRAALAGIPIQGYYPNQKKCNFFAEQSHVFHIVTQGRHRDTAIALEQFQGIILRMLEALGLFNSVISGNNLMVNYRRIGLMTGPKVKGAVCIKSPIATPDAISISQTLNNKLDRAVVKSIFCDEAWEITDLQSEIGNIAPKTILSKLISSNPSVFSEDGQPRIKDLYYPYCGG